MTAARPLRRPFAAARLVPAKRLALTAAFLLLGLAVPRTHAANPEPPADDTTATRTFKVLVMPYWNLSGPSFAGVEEGIARQLLKSSSALARNERFELLPYETVQKVLQNELTGQERKAFAQFLKNGTEHGDVEQAEPFLQTILQGGDADLLVFGSFRKLGAGPTLNGQAEVTSLLLFRKPDGTFDPPVTHDFKLALEGSLADLYQGVATDPFWTDDKPIQNVLRHATLNPTEWQLKMDVWGSRVEKDRWWHVQNAFPSELLGAHTCSLTDEQRDASALATQQLIRLDREQGNPRVYNYRGLVEFCGGNELAALERFRQATSLDPAYPEAWYNAGLVELREGRRNKDAARIEAAASAFTTALKNRPDFAEAYARRALARIEQNRTREASADATRATGLAPQSPEALLSRCALAVAEKRGWAGVEDCNAATKIEPDLAEAYKLIGDIYAGRRMTNAAVDAYRRAGEIAPRYFEARIPLLQVLFDAKQFDEVQTEARRMMSTIPTHSVPHYWLGKACEAAGDLACALEGYRDAAAIDPNWTALAEDVKRVESRMAGSAGSSTTSGGGTRAQTDSPPPRAREDKAGKAASSYEEFLRKYEQAKQQP